MNKIKWIGSGLTLGSAALLAFLNAWEDGGRDGMTVYADKFANGLPTACYGITKHVTDVTVIVGEYWSKEKCDRVMSVAVTRVQLELLDCMTHEPPQGVFDAVSSLAWNVGAPKACGSQSVKYINSGDYVTGCNLIATKFNGQPNWSYAAGIYLQGLQNRRKDERDVLCLPGIYE